MFILAWFSVVIGIVTLLLLKLVFSHLIAIVTVNLQSMSPTIEHGDRVLVLRCWPKKWLRKGQIILISSEHEYRSMTEQDLFRVTYIKRIAALGGELFTYAKDANNKEDPTYQTELENHSQQTWYIPDGYIFVCGDNRQASVDSFIWGPLPVKQVLGVMLLKLPGKDKHASSPLITQKFSPLPLDNILVGENAPMFVAQTLSDELVTLDTFAGCPVVLLFFAPAQHCVEVLNICKILAHHGKINGFDIICVSCTNDEPTSAFVEKYHIDFPILLAPRSSNPFFADYNIYGTPAYCVIDAFGKVLSIGRFSRNENIEQQLTNILISRSHR